MRLIDADVLVNMQMFDPEHEEHYTERMTIKECLDSFTDDGCPPTIEPMQWIPCSERLPKYDDWKIITILDESGDTPSKYTDFGWYLEAASCWIVDAEQRTDVIAWMPLPKPWNGADDES